MGRLPPSAGKTWNQPARVGPRRNRCPDLSGRLFFGEGKDGVPQVSVSQAQTSGVLQDPTLRCPEEDIWLAKQKSKRTRRAYKLDVRHFMHAQYPFL